MVQVETRDGIDSSGIELAELGRSTSLLNHEQQTSSSRSNSCLNPKLDNGEVDSVLQWSVIERLPTIERLRTSLIDAYNNGESERGKAKRKKIVDVSKLGPLERQMFIDKLIKNIEKDNLLLLQKLRERMDRVSVKLPTVEVRYKNLSVEAQCQLVRGKPLPTLCNSLKGMICGMLCTKVRGTKSQQLNVNIIKNVSGIIKPRRMTLLLGPPGCGKTTLLMALSAKLDQSLKHCGGPLSLYQEISYNGHKLNEFIPQKTSAYISQHDLHIPEMTVRETLDFSACCQGVGSWSEIMMEVIRREKEAGIIPDTHLDAYMKGISVGGLENSLQTDYILKILGLDICAETMVGNALRRGISGGQKKRLTTGEMIVGPSRVLFMDEISNGLDSASTLQIVSYVQHLVHITEATAVVSLLQPAPETYDLFDDVILMAEGKIVYHGPCARVLDFFEDCGFKCTERKGTADYLQEVISKKDQKQYWYRSDEPYSYISVDQFSKKFKSYQIGKELDDELSVLYDKLQCPKYSLCFRKYSLTKWELLKACLKREILLMRRNSFVYVIQSTRLFITALITMTVFLRSRMKVDVVHANDLLGSLFFALIILIVDGMPEIFFTVSNFAVFYKQKQSLFYPAWAYAIPAAVLKIPVSVAESVIWTALTYYVIGYSPEFGRFIRQFILLFAVHLMSMAMFRFLASSFKTVSVSATAGSFSFILLSLFGGFIISKASMPAWLKWGFWVSPMTYGEIGLSGNEFLAPRWQIMLPSNTTIGRQTLMSRGLNFDSYFYWISLAALFGFTMLFHVGFMLALTFSQPPASSHAIISIESLAQINRREDFGTDDNNKDKTTNGPKIIAASAKGRMLLPFKPLTMAFQNVQYFIDTPLEMRKRGFTQEKLQLLHDITGAFVPGVLTALIGVSGAGKTTLLDVLSGRKTGGTIEGDIRISGYPKSQETFARISGYCEQNDIHSPQITVEESVIYSAWLRLPSDIDSNSKSEFVNEVLETIELDGIRDALVGIPGVNGLSTEQRKRLTIAVELVANPSIIFMDEPTTSLDARAAAIVMRAVKNVANTGRTVVCTIHQPSIDIFEAFDELILMKTGGHIIYSGPLGEHSSRIIEYLEAIPGVPRIKDNYNPATWMLEVTSTSMEAELAVDFAQIYRDSAQYTHVKEVVQQLCSPSLGSKDLDFPTPRSQNCWVQFKACLWKQNLSYWRNPSFNLTRIVFLIVSSLLLGVVFWKKGLKIDNQQDLFDIFGSMFCAVIFFGINNCALVLPFISIERDVQYREKFAEMYSSWAYSFAQVAIEIPYSFFLSILFLVITYPMVGYFHSAYKIIWTFYAMFSVLLSFNYLGMLLVSLTPNVEIASMLAAYFYTIFNLFTGFAMPGPQIPSWWKWFYYLSPTSWALNGLLASQYGDIEKQIFVFGETKTVSAFLSDYFGFHHDRLGIVAIVLAAFPIAYAFLFAYCIGKFNFQKR